MKTFHPKHLLIGTAVLLYLMGLLFTTSSSTIDIHLHDTYFIVAHQHILFLLGTFCLLLWVLYIVANRLLFSTQLQWMHVLLSTAACWLLGLLLLLEPLYFNTQKSAEVPNAVSWGDMERMQQFANALAVLILMFILAQLLLLIHLLWGIFKRFNRS